MVTGPDALRKVRLNQRKLSYLEFLAQMERNHPQNAKLYAEFRRRHSLNPLDKPGTISFSEMLAIGSRG
ncbi:hypothetical protein [Prosthecobacter sp.]|uniref:hypothetical protein n=1 Tax=Prosthecobacter sp. TaxID=1965333 RepID=UPI0025E30A52|nr:hypothetical protein [Prosthecobacter sp.]